MTERDVAWLGEAIDLAVRNVADGGGPFGAVIVRGDILVATGQNRVTRDLDPTAHAEMQAIRGACRASREFSLDGMTLYSSCEPCPMCVAAALWARLDRVVYAADRHDAARGGFDDLWFYDLFNHERSAWPVRIEAVRTADAAAPFDAWLADEQRVPY
jgi:guanine deaminase